MHISAYTLILTPSYMLPDARISFMKSVCLHNFHIVFSLELRLILHPLCTLLILKKKKNRGARI